jgi:hypothetical protein
MEKVFFAQKGLFEPWPVGGTGEATVLLIPADLYFIDTKL